ncbi:PAS domain S-box protein [Flavobacterium enshiense]|uniref:sensor histidine kinase n=1 Tax=Flavobacterium enshiense TaxID=1341165 RepID=UPI00345CFCCE
MSNILAVVHQNIEQSLKNSYATTISLALTIDDNGNVNNFEEVGKKLISSNNAIDAVQLVPNGVIKYTYPLKGNEAATDFDILNSTLHREAALKAVRTQKMYYVGPVRLKQGGTGIVGRLPIYKKGKFWGFSAVVIRFSTFIESSGIKNFSSDKYYFQLSKKNGTGDKEVFFLEDKSFFKDKTYKSVTIPEGDWTLYMIQKNESKLLWLTVPIFILAFILALICGMFITNILQKPSDLQKLVKEQTEKLIKSEFLFKSIFDNAGLGITHTNSITGAYIDVNNKFCDLTGYTRDELKEMTVMMITHRDDHENDTKHMNLLKNGDINGFSLEKRYHNKTGHLIWVNITVTPLWRKGENPTTHMTIVEDITKRKQYEKELLQSRLSLESLINTIDGIVWEGYPDRPGVTFISKQSESILGYTSEEWINDDNFWYNHLYSEDREKVIELTNQWSSLKKPHVHEYRMISKNGSLVWVRDIVNVFIEKDGSFKFRGILIDITKSKQIEIELSNSFKLVSEQNKRLLNFSHIVSHNLRSHTSNIQSLINLIELSEDKKEQLELLELLKTVSNTLNETMDNLNEVVSIQTNINPLIEHLNLNRFINRVQEILRDQIEKNNVEIINNVPDYVTVKFNPAYLESVLLNLISNSIRYRHPERKPIIELSYSETEGSKILKIKDNGIGIDLNKNGEKLFGMYKTFTNNPESRGIGLFITKNQIDAMNGRIEVESGLNNGTVFIIYFK